MNFGRKRGRKAKKTNVEIVVQEGVDKKSGKKDIKEQDEKRKAEAKEENKIAK